MSSPEPECAPESGDESSDEPRDNVPTPLRAEDDKIVSEMYHSNDELVTYTFRLLEQCITLSDAVAEVNQV